MYIVSFEASRKKKRQREQKSKNKEKHIVRFSREDRLLLPEDTESEIDSDDDVEDVKIDNFEL